MRERIGGGVGAAILVASIIAIFSLDVGGRGVVLGVFLGFAPGLLVAVIAMMVLRHVRQEMHTMSADIPAQPPVYEMPASVPPALPAPPQRRITIPHINQPALTASPQADVLDVYLADGSVAALNADAAYLFVSMEKPARQRNGVRVWPRDNTQFALVASVLESKGFVCSTPDGWRWSTPSAQRQARTWLDRWCTPTAAESVPNMAANVVERQTDTQTAA